MLLDLLRDCQGLPIGKSAHPGLVNILSSFGRGELWIVEGVSGLLGKVLQMEGGLADSVAGLLNSFLLYLPFYLFLV